MARRFRYDLAESGPFVCRCLNSRTMLRFHTPRLSNWTGAVNASSSRRKKDSRCRPRKAGGPRCQANQAKLLRQGLLGKPRVPSSPLFVFDTQPLTKPPAGVLLHRSVGLTDRPQTEVVSPTINLPIERFYQRCRILLGLTPADRPASYFRSPSTSASTPCSASPPEPHRLGHDSRSRGHRHN